MHQNDNESGKYILRGFGREIQRISDDGFAQSVKGLREKFASRLAFMSREHHQVRDFLVREMPGNPQPISPLRIAQALTLDVGKVVTILEDMEKHLFFLVRDEGGNVNWAFPVTVCRTPHRVEFSTGEKTFGA